MTQHTDYFLPDSGVVSPEQVRVAAQRRLESEGWSSTLHLHPAEADCDDSGHEQFGT